MKNTKAQHIQTGCSSQDLVYTSISYAKFAFFIVIAVCINLWLADTAFAAAAAAFKFDAGVTAATDPIIAAVKAHWGKGVLLTGAGFALFGEGDARQRAQRAAIGAAAAGATVLGLIATLT